MSRRAWAIFVKELVDNGRDSRSWLRALAFVLVGPLMLAATILFVAHETSDEGARSVHVPVVGAELAPGLVQFLAQHRVIAAPPPAEAESAVRDGREAIVLVIPPAFPDDFRAGRQAVVQLFFDDSRMSTQAPMHRVRSALQAYGQSVGALRLLARGVSPDIVHGIAIEDVDLATPQSRGILVFAVVPMFMLLSLFAGGLYVAIDATAGERERHSLEPLLANPVTPAEVLVGKIGAVFVFSLVTLAVTLGGFAFVINHAPAEIPSIRFGLPLPRVALLYAAMVPLSLLAAALEVYVSSQSRSFKEAHTAGQILMVLPVAPGMVILFAQLQPGPWMYAVPVFGQNLLIMTLLQGGPVPWLALGLGAVATLALAVAVIAVAVKRFVPHKVLFS